MTGKVKIFSLICLAVMPTYSLAEIVKLTDGRSLTLEDDGTYSFLENERRLNIVLQSVGSPSGYGANPNRDCELTFSIQNNLGGDIYNLNVSLIIINSEGSKVLSGGMFNYDLSPFSFSEKVLGIGGTDIATVDIEESCTRIKDVTIGDVSEKYCNFVGREPRDRCRNLIEVQSTTNIPLKK